MAEKMNILQVYNICRELVAQAEKSAEQNGGKVDESLLTPLRDTFEKIIDFEKMHLITAHDTFYGSMLMNMETKIDFTIRGPLDISVKKEPFVMKFNPLFITKYKYAEFTALVVSEILKLTYAHPASFSKINSGKDQDKHQKLEKSSAASVSNMVQHDIRLDKKGSKNLVLPQDAYTTSKLSQELGVNPKKDQALEYYYKVLEQFQKGNKDDGSGQNPDAQPMSGQGQGEGQSDPNAAATQNNENGQQTHQWYDEDSNDMKEKIKNMVSEVYNNMDEKSRGTMPGGLQEHIKALLKRPEISWKQLLRKYVGAIPVPHRSTKTRLNRRQPERSDLSGQLPKRHIELVVAIDTSGSMSSSDIAYVINEIFNIVKDYDSKVTIIECDAQIGKIYQAKKASDVQTKVSGRGGTSFLPVIEHINESGKYKNALMVYFTDGYGDSQIPRPRTFRNLWVVLQDEKYLSLKEPYGEVKALRKDTDWIKQNEGN
jgi:predicted metal-dependent peptidase